jgi:hypothetical protein
MQMPANSYQGTHPGLTNSYWSIDNLTTIHGALSC